MASGEKHEKSFFNTVTTGADQPSQADSSKVNTTEQKTLELRRFEIEVESLQLNMQLKQLQHEDLKGNIKIKRDITFMAQGIVIFLALLLCSALIFQNATTGPYPTAFLVAPIISISAITIALIFGVFAKGKKDMRDISEVSQASTTAIKASTSQ